MRHLFLLSVLFSSACLGLSPGEKAPDFRLKATDGKEIHLGDVLGSHAAAVLIFVGTRCPYSNAYNERLNKLVEALRTRPRKVALLAINPNDNEPLKEVRQHAAEKHFLFPVLKDEGRRVADLFRAEKTPEAYLIGPKGDVLYRGRVDDDTEGKNVTKQDLIAAVDEYLAGKPITVKETKAFGCTIFGK